MEIQRYECVIVANGSFPTSQIPLELLEKAKTVIACDGAIKSLHERGIRPEGVIGDLDSIPDELRDLYADRIHQVEDQEINDLTKSVRYAQANGHKDILILGATGLREDHTLGNISLLLDYAPMFNRVEMVSDYGIFTPILRSTTLPCDPGQQVSLFALYPEGEITTEGLRWTIHQRTLTSWWQGSLNEAVYDRFTITLTPGSKVLVYRNFQSPNQKNPEK